MTWPDILIASATVFVGSTLQGSVGFGLGLLASPILILIDARFVPAPILLSTLVLTTAMMGAGLDLESAFGAVISSINLLGPGLGDVSETFATVTPTVKWLAMCGMLIGRLEVFTLLILFLPSFWRH